VNTISYNLTLILAQCWRVMFKWRLLVEEGRKAGIPQPDLIIRGSIWLAVRSICGVGSAHGRDEVVVVSAEEFRRLKGESSGDALMRGA
jgi:hypothetical protein